MGLLAAGGTMMPFRAAAQEKPGAAKWFFDVRSFGATGDGKTLDTASFNAAIEACHGAGGGVVYVPPGT